MQSATPSNHARLLTTLEYLLALPATDVHATLDPASQRIATALGADKVDIFLYEAPHDTLVATGVSPTPMGQREIALGLDRLPLSNGGKTVQVFQTGQSYRSGNLRADPEELRGVTEGLGIQSVLVVPLTVAGVRRGAIQVDSAQPDRFTADDLSFLAAVAHWIGLLLDRAELVERLAAEAAQQARQVAAEELITILAHDLRTPLTPLVGRAELLRARAEREGHTANLKDAETILRSIDRMEHLISDLLDTARLEQGLFRLYLSI